MGVAAVSQRLSGEIIHRDSLGAHAPIWPAALSWMTAGRSVACKPVRRSRCPRDAANTPHTYLVRGDLKHAGEHSDAGAMLVLSIGAGTPFWTVEQDNPPRQARAF